MTFPRLDRVDRYVARIAIVDAEEFATIIEAEREPGMMAAVLTPEGYLMADGYLARDGLLEYSDGSEVWTEYRPRQELVDAAASWATTPLTDDHPKAMVDATTWTQVARGIHMAAPTVGQPNLAGVSFMLGRLLFTDADLVKRIQSGEQAELSIGFTSVVVPTENGFAPDGTRADAVQTKMLGNHTAAVSQGRAGPTVRVLLDGAAQTVYNVKDLMAFPTRKPARKDEAGAPTDMVELTGPDGVPVQLPTWVAAALQELAQLQAQAPAAPAPAAPVDPMAAPAAPVAPEDAALPVPAPAVAPADAAPPAPPAAPAAGPDDEDKDAKDSKDEEEEETMKDAAIDLRIRKRSRLERLAASAGVESFDGDDAALSREYIAKLIPTAKLDGLNQAGLDVLVETAASLPVPKADAPDVPWLRVAVQPEARADSAEATAEAAYLSSQGY